MWNRNSVVVFRNESLDAVLEAKQREIFATIESETENYILNINETDYVEHLLSNNKIEPVKLDFKNVFVSDEEQLIPAEKFPYNFNVYSGKSYKKSVIIYHIPFEGDYLLLAYKTNPNFLGWEPEFRIIDNCVCIEIIAFDENNPDYIKHEAEHTISKLKEIIGHHTTQITKFYNQLPTEILAKIKSRKETLLKKRNLVASLGVPIKKVENLPTTYSIPFPKIKQKISVKPIVKDTSYIPDPAIDDGTYFQILQLIHDVGQIFEKYPSTYEGKDEESLRDLFLFQLQPRFEGEASAETFNKSGKTDIIIKHEGKNVFVAECKFWHGQKQYLDTIDQLLGYLTWRDSKTAVIVFVKNKDFSGVLSQIKDISSQHPCFQNFINQKDDTWFNFIFHIPGDRNKSIKLAVLLFHVPSE